MFPARVGEGQVGAAILQMAEESVDWSTFGQTVAVAATGLSAAAAAWAANEARLIRVQQSSPEVIVYLEPNPTVSEFRDLVIHNIGMAPAFAVHLRRLEEVAPFDSLDFDKTALEDEGISILAPQGQLRLLLGLDQKISDDERRLSLEYYTDKRLRKKDLIKTPITLRPAEFRGLYRVVDSRYQAFKSLRGAMDKLKNGRIEITVKSSDIQEYP